MAYVSPNISRPRERLKDDELHAIRALVGFGIVILIHCLIIKLLLDFILVNIGGSSVYLWSIPLLVFLVLQLIFTVYGAIYYINEWRWDSKNKSYRTDL